MAVRNMDAIARKAQQLAEEKKAKEESKIKSYQVYLDAITQHRQDAIDAVDTKKALAERNIPTNFSNDTRIAFGRYEKYSDRKYSLIVKTDSGSVEYYPEGGVFKVTGCGLYKTFKDAQDLGTNGIRDFFEYPGEAFKEKTEQQREALIALSEGFLPFLHAFFNFVDNL